MTVLLDYIDYVCFILNRSHILGALRTAVCSNSTQHTPTAQSSETVYSTVYTTGYSTIYSTVYSARYIYSKGSRNLFVTGGLSVKEGVGCASGAFLSDVAW